MKKYSLLLLLLFVFPFGCEIPEPQMEEGSFIEEKEEKESCIIEESKEELKEKATTYLKVSYGDKTDEDINGEELIHPEAKHNYSEDGEFYISKRSFQLYNIGKDWDFELVLRNGREVMDVMVDVDVAITGTRSEYPIALEFSKHEDQWLLLSERRVFDY